MNLHPVDTPTEFDRFGPKCVNAINHHASGLRKKDAVAITLD